MKIDWKRKFTSRKFWLAVASFFSGLVLAFSGKADDAQTVAGCIMSAASVVAYIIGEGFSDSSHFEKGGDNNGV